MPDTELSGSTAPTGSTVAPTQLPAALPENVAVRLGETKANQTDPRRAMPSTFYTSAEVADAEKQAVFFESWLCVGRADEIPNSGDYFTTVIIDESLVVVRGDDESVRVLSNVCRHRSTLIAEGAGSARQLMCPYHQWSYALDGSLKRAPMMDKVEGFDPTDCGLPSFAVEEWMGWVFVNLSGTAEPLAPQIAGLDEYVAGYHPEEMRTVKASPEVWPVNWKCLGENFMEGYHLTPVHLNTLHPMTPTSLCEKIEGQAAFTGYKSHYPASFEGRPPFHPDMSDEQQRMSMMVWIYPGFVAAISPNSSVYMSLTPAGPQEVQTRWGVIARDDLFDEGTAMDRWDFAASYNAEDKVRLVALQSGLNSRFASAGPLAPDDLEGCTWDFYNYLARRLLPE